MENKGFTLVEVVIAIFILSVAIFAVYNAFSIMVVLTANISNRLTAAYLAQEGMEIIRNIRDNNWINGAAWNGGLSDCQEEGCQVDYTAGTAAANPAAMTSWTGQEPSGANAGGGIFLKLNPSGFYSYDATGSDTKFKRKIVITFPETYIMRVSVKVFWNEKGDWSQNMIETEETLYDWY